MIDGKGSENMSAITMKCRALLDGTTKAYSCVMFQKMSENYFLKKCDQPVLKSKTFSQLFQSYHGTFGFSYVLFWV